MFRNDETKPVVVMCFSIRETTFSENCTMHDVDMVFVIDSSTSVGSGNFEKMKRFLVDVTERLSKDSRVAVVRFSDAAETVISFGDHNNKEDLKGAFG